MLQRPSFKPHYHVEVVEGDGVVLISEKGHAILRGRLYELMTPLLDGRRSVDEIAYRLRDHAHSPEVYDALSQMETQGYLDEGSETMPASEAAFWAIQDVAPRRAAERLNEATVSVDAFGAVEAEDLLAILQSLRVRVGRGGSLGVVLTDDYLRGGLRLYNEEALRSARPWMVVKPVGCEVWIGPLFIPERTGCWECLAQRLRANREVETLLQEKKRRDEPFPAARGSTSSSRHMALNLAATKIAEWVVTGELSSLEGRVLTFDLRDCQTRTHMVVWQPQCPACGDPADNLQRPAHPVVLESRKKNFTQDGGHRVLSPEQTLKRYEHHISPISGAVSRLERHSMPDDTVMHVYSAGRNVAVRQHGQGAPWLGLRSRSGGKGASDQQAKASGLCEALERYSGIFRGDEPRRRAKLKDLGGAAIHPNACMRFSRRQYEQRQYWNMNDKGFVPAAFDEEAEVEWTPVWSLTRRESRFLPTAFCYYDYPAGEEIYCVACSNGNAAGNTLEEAILQGFLELVERDSVALWWYNRVSRPEVNLDSFEEPYLGKLRDYLRKHRRSLWVLDLTADLSVPVFAALSRRTDGEPEQIMFGFGAHLDPRIALMRAVTELNQMQWWVIANEDRQTPAYLTNSYTSTWLRTATVSNQPYLVADASAPARVASDYPQNWTDDLRDDVLACQSLVERHGMEMLVLDQTRPDIGLPVVKVVVPGLRHFWPRFAPGRLYDVPVELGWLAHTLSEEQLNPVPMFL
jgi:bacteriocin biosynthesis cyclodehydratase domain-containing protein